MYICDFSRSEGAGSANVRNTRGLTRSVIARIVPPLPAPSRPSNTTIARSPLCLTHSWSLQSSACRRRSSPSYSLRFIRGVPFTDSTLAICHTSLAGRPFSYEATSGVQPASARARLEPADRVPRGARAGRHAQVAARERRTVGVGHAQPRHAPPGSAVAHDHGLVAAPEHPVVGPLAQRGQHGQQRLALLGEPVFEALAIATHVHAREDAVVD